MASSPGQFRSLLDGEIDVAFTSPDNVLAYRFGPTNPLGALPTSSIVSTVDRGCGLGALRPAGLRGPERLRGAVVGVDVPTSGFAPGDVLPRRAGWGWGRDEYRLVALGSTPRRLEALLAGECDATMLNAGNELLAEQAGCVLLARWPTSARRTSGRCCACTATAGWRTRARLGRSPARQPRATSGTARGRRRGGRGRAAAGPAARARRAVRRPAHVRGRGADPVRRARPRRPRDHRRPAPHAPAGPGGGRSTSSPRRWSRRPGSLAPVR